MNFSGLTNRITHHPKWFAAILFGLVCLATYGWMIPFVGFYGDDWGYIWLLFKGAGIDVFFQNNRENIPPIFKALSLILGYHPIAWQFYNLFLRWISAFLFWLILDKLWPKLKQFTILAAIFAIIYPGYRLSYVSVNMSIFFIVLSCFYLSIYLNLILSERRKNAWFLIPISLVLAYMNIALTEYFFFMEMVRPVILFIYLDKPAESLKLRLRNTLLAWWPFLILFSGAVIWRATSQSEINGFYTLKLLEDLKIAPFSTIFTQFKQMAQDIWTTAFQSWGNALLPFQWLKSQHLSSFFFFIPAIILSGLIFFLLWQIGSRFKQDEKNPQTGWIWIGLGLVWSILSGWPVWLAELRIGVDFASTRFALPLIPGAIIITVGILMLVSRFRRAQMVVISLLIGSSMIYQVLIGNAYRMDWIKQKHFYSQLFWRFEGIRPGSLFVLSQSPSSEGEENALSAEMSWFFSPGKDSTDLDYYGYFIPERFYHDNQQIFDGQHAPKGHHIGAFTATLDQLVSIQTDSRNCLRVLYPEVDELNPHLTELTRQMAKYSSPAAITGQPQVDTLTILTDMFGKEPIPDWCKLYQQADLLRQQNDWDGITRLAANLNPREYYQDWQKLSLFVEAYARMGQPDQAAELVQEMNSIPPKEQAVYCHLTSTWLTVLDPTGSFLEEINQGRNKLKCSTP